MNKTESWRRGLPPYHDGWQEVFETKLIDGTHYYRLRETITPESGASQIMREVLDDVRQSGQFRVQERVFTKPSDPLTDLVSRFSTALLEKLRAAEKKYGRKDDWLDPNWEADCQRQLLEHVAKGDPRDVAAYAAFCWHHGWPTSSPLSPSHSETP